MTDSAIEKWVRRLVNDEMQIQINNRRLVGRAWVIQEIQERLDADTKDIKWEEFRPLPQVVFQHDPTKEILDHVKIEVEDCKGLKKPLPKTGILNKRSPMNGNWGGEEELYLKDQVNDFIEKQGRIQRRTPASIKGKVFHLLQQSYGRI